MSSSITINDQKYNWMEISRGNNRGMRFNPGQHQYIFTPNPHNDKWYNKNQMTFYALAAKQVEAKGNSGRWTTDNWPSSINNIDIHGITYTLQ
ncbi:hypothetical protein V7131_22300 [Bacillus sp. JJ269]|uniref:hypothetical protein n=1 Tax=Bacillus sp. JJ269 TaxID=3122966 RepID=UPI002FFDC026